MSRLAIALLTMGLTFASIDAQAQGVKVCSGFDFLTCPNAVVANKDAFVRVEFAKPLAEVFQETFGQARVTSGKFSFVVKQAPDAAPLVSYESTLLVSRYEHINTLDLTLQADDQTLKDLAEGTLADPALRDLWLKQKKKLGDKQRWQVFVYFALPEGDGKLVAQGEFDYALKAASIPAKPNQAAAAERAKPAETNYLK